MNSLPGSYQDELTALEVRGLRRWMRRISGSQSSELTVDGRRVVNFSSNNYLGLADHPWLMEAAAQSMAREGFGAGGSRLIVGNLDVHRQLEERIAAWQGTESALVFNSGYQANVGLLSALTGPDDALYVDELNHASLIDGARLSRAAVHILPHRDLHRFEEALAAGGRYRRRLIATDAVFSMDGERAPLEQLVGLAQRYQAELLVDEAHALGVLGRDGAGLSTGLAVDLRMGTFSKALGGFGAFVAGSRQLIELLLHRARSFVFSTALPVPVVAWAAAAIDLVCSAHGAQRRELLANRCTQLHSELTSFGVAPSHSSHIVPIPIGDAQRTMAVSEALLQRGIFLQGIRPPTVPEGTSRLRLALMATHTEAQITQVCEGLAEQCSHLAASHRFFVRRSKSPPVLFVTGTDTGVGKTRVACALVAAWRRAGRRVAVFKPIATGCTDGPPEDAVALAAAAGWSDEGAVAPLRFALPAAPAVAAHAEGRAIGPHELALLDQTLVHLSRQADAIVVEGAGGLLVPIQGSFSMADLAARFSAQLLIVARTSLGTLNHTLLTLEAARRRNLPLAGLVLNQLSAHPGPDEPTTPDTLAELGHTPLRGTLPYRPGELSPAELAELAGQHLDVEGIWQKLISR